MEEGFIKENQCVEKTEEEKDIDLIRSVIKTKMDLEVARQNFEYAEGELIDYYSYKIKADQSKLDYLLKKVKNKSLALDMINEIKLRLSEDKAI
ncbi:MAG: DUF2508 family protein [Clostridia bacterium]|nr:DUF2508 family protein [Clostridia bacterium]